MSIGFDRGIHNVAIRCDLAPGKHARYELFWTPAVRVGGLKVPPIAGIVRQTFQGVNKSYTADPQKSLVGKSCFSKIRKSVSTLYRIGSIQRKNIFSFQIVRLGTRIAV